MGQDKGKSLFREGVSYLHVGRGQRMGKFYINRRSKSCGHSDANFTSLKRGGLYKKWIYKLNFADSHGARRSKPGRWEKDSYKSQYINSGTSCHSHVSLSVSPPFLTSLGLIVVLQSLSPTSFQRIIKSTRKNT